MLSCSGARYGICHDTCTSLGIREVTLTHIIICDSMPRLQISDEPLSRVSREKEKRSLHDHRKKA